jgi:peroxiredoxin (alkyl hydroperoxide reductase subunit C)
VETKREEGGLGGNLKYPLLSDLNKVAARDYGILTGDESVALRGLFLISPDGILMHATINNLSVGRSTNEALRVLKAFRFVSTQEGKDTMIANSDGMREYLANH